MPDPCPTCIGPFVWVAMIPHVVRCAVPGHYWSVPPLDLRVPKRPQAGSAAAKEIAR